MRSSILLVLALFFAGCSKKEPKVIYKDVFMPIRCEEAMPLKPKNDGTFDAHKRKMTYYLECENTLKRCLGAQDE